MPYPNDRNLQTYDKSPGFKPLTVLVILYHPSHPAMVVKQRTIGKRMCSIIQVKFILIPHVERYGNVECSNYAPKEEQL